MTCFFLLKFVFFHIPSKKKINNSQISLVIYLFISVKIKGQICHFRLIEKLQKKKSKFKIKYSIYIIYESTIYYCFAYSLEPMRMAKSKFNKLFLKQVNFFLKKFWKWKFLKIKNAITIVQCVNLMFIFRFLSIFRNSVCKHTTYTNWKCLKWRMTM